MTEAQTTTDAPDAPKGAEVREPGGGDLETLLKEWRAETQPNRTEPPKEVQQGPRFDPKEIEGALAYVRESRARDVAKQTDEAIRATVANIKKASEDLNAFPDELVESFLHMQGNKNSDFLNAFVNRSKAPEKWAQVEAQLARNLSEVVSKLPKASIAQDQAAVRAAVRNLSSKPSADAPPDYAKMNLAQLKAVFR